MFHPTSAHNSYCIDLEFYFHFLKKNLNLLNFAKGKKFINFLYNFEIDPQPLGPHENKDKKLSIRT